MNRGREAPASSILQHRSLRVFEVGFPGLCRPRSPAPPPSRRPCREQPGGTSLRKRGWTLWHYRFSPRLAVLGTSFETSNSETRVANAGNNACTFCSSRSEAQPRLAKRLRRHEPRTSIGWFASTRIRRHGDALLEVEIQTRRCRGHGRFGTRASTLARGRGLGRLALGQSEQAYPKREQASRCRWPCLRPPVCQSGSSDAISSSGIGAALAAICASA